MTTFNCIPPLLKTLQGSQLALENRPSLFNMVYQDLAPVSLASLCSIAGLYTWGKVNYWKVLQLTSVLFSSLHTAWLSLLSTLPSEFPLTFRHLSLHVTSARKIALSLQAEAFPPTPHPLQHPDILPVTTLHCNCLLVCPTQHREKLWRIPSCYPCNLTHEKDELFSTS